MNITIKIEKPSRKPGVTGADWWIDDNCDLQVRVAPMGDWRYETCLALHEAIEAVLCHQAGVTHEQVDDYDIPYEATHPVKCNAGDEPDAPYRKQHGFATAAERMIAAELGVVWLDYESQVEAL